MWGDISEQLKQSENNYIFYNLQKCDFFLILLKHLYLYF